MLLGILYMPLQIEYRTRRPLFVTSQLATTSSPPLRHRAGTNVGLTSDYEEPVPLDMPLTLGLSTILDPWAAASCGNKNSTMIVCCLLFVNDNNATAHHAVPAGQGFQSPFQLWFLYRVSDSPPLRLQPGRIPKRSVLAMVHFFCHLH
jgi:hypothetical protein